MDDWERTDAYLTDTLIGADPQLEDALAANAAAGLPPIDVAPVQGKFLHLLARIRGARRILEIGTLGGYSTIWLARAVGDDGRVVTLEYEPRHAEVARANLDRAGVGERVDIRVGAALDTLPSLEGGAPFDLVFVDADKENNPHYVRWALRLGRPGTVIVVDNVIRGGSVTNADLDDERVRGAREVLELMATDPRLDATALQTVGAKGWDGFAIAVVTD
ncbi:methyltransferase [Rhodococcus sp. WB1]|uniref:O-methyltransferase n=1 Tax=Rhodococcus TaxID=1827 RepID=UPI00081A3EAB|nr:MULTISPECIES: O-methyltransferase [Rhodococcus]ANZ25505.1 methyltransferase [Rhodococcus sp. WB1]MDV6291693.1 O-methyltransferase [Rhodococcus aetherivorans]PND50687.1 O-methyltransferase [Rhodococcus sp. ENV425]USC17653.1 O-methyltransferase [Rhodococcus sp. 11-3]WKX00994.1 O-methyltransferase [Rhodococcus aetherivorans]